MAGPVPPELAVSIQADDARGEPWRGHLAAGVLLDTDLVLVPDPPQRLVDGSVTVEALFVPLPFTAAGRVERIRPDRLDVLRPAGPDGPAAAVLRLSRPVRHPARLPGYDGCALNEALRRTGDDLWAALIEIGIATGATRDGPPEEIQRLLPEVERRQWRHQIRVHDGNPLGNWVCFFSPKCRPCSPQ